MQAIIPNQPVRSLPYAWNSILCDPDVCVAGMPAIITLPLLNPGPDAVTIDHIDLQTARFGIGLPWESLESIDGLVLPADMQSPRMVATRWTPRASGHHCIRAAIYVQHSAHPFRVGRNLRTVQADADEDTWTIPFLLGSPDTVAAPVRLQLGGMGASSLEMELRIDGRLIAMDRAIELRPREVVSASVQIRARTSGSIRAVRTIEAFIHRRFVDGIGISVQRPAQSLPISQIGRDREILGEHEASLANLF